ncbi:MAG: hypothetical protein ACOZIN_07370 [Myxococcota bacterium]
MRPNKVGEALLRSPERIAAAWRRLRSAEVTTTPHLAHLLDGVVEAFIRELGATLVGAHGHPWGRCRGVLRLSHARGTQALYAEFAALRHCLGDAVEALGGGDLERTVVNHAIDDAVDSAVALLGRLRDAGLPPARVQFGGVVLEVFDGTRSGRHTLVAIARRQTLH